jgi:hypothetical protein
MNASPSAYDPDETATAGRIIATPSHRHLFSEVT